jgi:hypothetical protein
MDMWLGTGDHWTTWLAVLAHSGEQVTLGGFRYLTANHHNKEEAIVRGK